MKLLEFSVTEHCSAKKELRIFTFTWIIEILVLTKRVTKCMEFFNYLKISELTNTFLLKPPDHSGFSGYMSKILAYCLQLRKQVDLEDFCRFQMFECFFYIHI